MTSTTTTVVASSPPWRTDGGINAAYSVPGMDGALAGSPTVVATGLATGDVLRVTWLSGTTSIGTMHGYGFYGPLGGPSGSSVSILMGWVLGYGGLCGAFTDSSGVVVLAVNVGVGGTFTTPAGATQLQLGINDGTNWVDNSGAFVVSVGPATAPVVGLYFPQVNGNLIMTQLPYSSVLSFGTVVTDIESGMRWTFSRRGNTELPTVPPYASGYPLYPLGKFAINYSCITDAEVATLLAFFRGQRGRWGTWRLLDPGGNLLQHSEDFGATEWDLTNGVSIAGHPADDPFNPSSGRATTLSGAVGDSWIMAPVGPPGTDPAGMSGFVVCPSCWVRAHSPGQTILVGVTDAEGTIVGRTWTLSTTAWTRVGATVRLWNDDYYRFVLGTGATWSGTQLDVFGAQVSPMKGEGPYVASPPGWGYHEHVRFETDEFAVNAVGPNENALQLPCVEVNGG